MIGLFSALGTEIIFEAAKFIITILLLVLAVKIGGGLRMRSDAKKAALASKSESEKGNITE